MRPVRRNPVFPTVKSRRPKAFPYAPVRQVLQSDGGDDERYPHKTRQIRAPETLIHRTVSVGRKPETKPGPRKKRILQRFGRPHPFQPIPSPRRRFPAGWIPQGRSIPSCGIKIPLIPPDPGRGDSNAVTAPFQTEKPPAGLSASVVSASHGKAAIQLHRLRPEKRFCQRGPPEQKRKAAESALFQKRNHQRLS